MTSPQDGSPEGPRASSDAPPAAPLIGSWQPAAPARPAESPRGAAARLAWLSVFVVLGSLVALGAASAPALARELGLSRAEVVHRPWVRGTPEGRAGIDAVRAFEEDLEAPHGRPPRIEIEDEDLDPPPSTAIRTARVLESTPLRALPGEAAKPIGLLGRGDEVVVITIEGGSALVSRRTPPPQVAGWVSVSALAVGR